MFWELHCVSNVSKIKRSLSNEVTLSLSCSNSPSQENCSETSALGPTLFIRLKLEMVQQQKGLLIKGEMPSNFTIERKTRNIPKIIAKLPRGILPWDCEWDNMMSENGKAIIYFIFEGIRYLSNQISLSFQILICIHNLVVVPSALIHGDNLIQIIWRHWASHSRK